MTQQKEHHIAYSVAPLGTIRQLFLVARPEDNFLCGRDELREHGRSVRDWPRQVRSLLESCRDVMLREGFSEGAVMSNFFMADLGKKELVRNVLAELFPKGLGATTFIPQAPADGSALVMELWALAEERPARDQLFLEAPLPGRVVVAEFGEMRWFFTGEVRPDDLALGAYRRSSSAFHRLGDRLKDNDFPFDRLLRTWIYQGHLVLEETSPSGETIQRYKELNRARSDFFDGVHFIERYLPDTIRGRVYPASTGIGADDVDVVLGAVAVDTRRSDFLAVPLENPNQTPAFDYGKAYSPSSPKFSRAMAIATEESGMIFVSGTAGITESESRHAGDPVAQTELTLDNIAALVDGENLRRHGVSGFSSDISNLRCVRVYVKRPDEYEPIREVCRRRLGPVPILYTIADVCRPELLVEIEGIAALSRR